MIEKSWNFHSVYCENFLPNFREIDFIDFQLFVYTFHKFIYFQELHLLLLTKMKSTLLTSTNGVWKEFEWFQIQSTKVWNVCILKSIWESRVWLIQWMKLVLKNCWKIIEECPQCGNYGNLLLHLFDENFVKVTFLVKKLLKS